LCLPSGPHSCVTFSSNMAAITCSPVLAVRASRPPWPPRRSRPPTRSPAQGRRSPPAAGRARHGYIRTLHRIQDLPVAKSGQSNGKFHCMGGCLAWMGNAENSGTGDIAAHPRGNSRITVRDPPCTSTFLGHLGVSPGLGPQTWAILTSCPVPGQPGNIALMRRSGRNSGIPARRQGCWSCRRAAWGSTTAGDRVGRCDQLPQARR
jgi:hypothetical protein